MKRMVCRCADDMICKCEEDTVNVEEFGIMTRKDYIEFARMVADLPEVISREELIKRLSDILWRDNPRFDKDKFRNYIKLLLERRP